MWEAVKAALSSPAGSFGFAASLTILFFWVAFWLHGKFVSLVAKHDHLSEKCDDVRKHADDAYDRLDKRIESLRDDMHEMRGDLQYIKSMINIQINTPVSGKEAMVQAHSPLSLTDVGRQAVTDMNASDAVAISWDRIKSIMDAEIVGRNPYDIQTYCLEKITISPERFFEQRFIDSFKIYAFNHGRTLFECMKVIGILVRDKYFEELGIPLSSLDDPAPTK